MPVWRRFQTGAGIGRPSGKTDLARPTSCRARDQPAQMGDVTIGTQSGTRSAIAYRPDIDGLRGIAILAVVAYHGKFVAAPEAKRRQAQREVAHVVAIGGPAVGLPDAAALFADAGALGILIGVALQQLGQRRGLDVIDQAHGRPPLLPAPR